MKKKKDILSKLTKEELGKKLKKETAILKKLKHELEVESSLEKVRAVALGMQRPADMPEICRIISRQLETLGLEEIRNIQTAIFYPAKGTYMNYEYYAKHDKTFITETIYTNHEIAKAFAAKMLKGKGEISVTLIKGEKKIKEWLAYQKSTNVFIDTFLETASSLNYYWFSLGPVALGISTYVALSDDELRLFKRFLNVFELAYRRYIDIELAMGQAREAQIELALERIRAKAMAMQQSDELSEVLSVLFDQFDILGIYPSHATISLLDLEKNSFTFRMTGKRGRRVMAEQVISLDSLNMWKDTVDQLKNFRDVQVYSNEYPVTVLPKLWELCSEVIAAIPEDARPYPEDFPDGMYEAVGIYRLSGGTTYGTISFCHNRKATEEEKDIIGRFATEFGRLYQRFLDLQKAEAQAREAQIEVSLERVRSKAMAMQKSEDLAHAVAIVFQELDKLNLGMLRCGIGILNKEKRSADVWTTTKSDNNTVVQVSGDESMDIHPLLQGAFEAWMNQEDHSYILKGEDLNDYYKAIAGTNFKLPDSQSLITGSEGIQQYYYNAVFSSGGLFAFRETEFPEEAKFVLKRFADVFTLTYTRFNDLKQAEAQAKEAQIETALEKVRSRSMGMQKSEELREVGNEIYKQLVQLNFNIGGDGFILDYPETDDLYLWGSDRWGAAPDQIHYPYINHPYFNRYKEAKDKGLDFLIINNTFEEKNTLFDHFFQYLPAYTPEIKEIIYASPGLVTAHVFLKNVVLYVWNMSGTLYSETENATLIRFGKVFEQAYIRFNDLKQAEAQAQEAIKRASVDRVRAEIASMRTTADLEKITPLIWNELTILGVPFIRCGVFIMDDSQQLIHTFLSSPDGKAIAAFHLPYDTPGNIAQVLNHWHNKKNYIDHWDESAFTAFADILVKQGDLASAEQYLKTIPHGGFYLHFLPFLQGMLYVGNSTQLKEEIKLIQSVADAFSTAYARYEDFNKLEAAKQQVEKTLTDLKQAQTQLVQSEKMASLGELTAGIAHEIQNPLNFVNNFSEVSNELLDEMTEELEKGNYKEAIEIANNVKKNLEKINNHGKRADGIVKGMLQHSRTSSGQKELTDINSLTDEYLRLSYHGLRAKDKSFNAKFETDFDDSAGKVNVIPQEIGRVVLNLINNAFYAVSEKKKLQQSGYEPTVTISTLKVNGKIEIKVKDNGNGIPQKVLDKIFQPFFTTKPTGQGTGLGLSLAYDIITKGHGGELKVETKEGEGAVFIIQLPNHPTQ